MNAQCEEELSLAPESSMARHLKPVGFQDVCSGYYGRRPSETHKDNNAILSRESQAPIKQEIMWRLRPPKQISILHINQRTEYNVSSNPYKLLKNGEQIQ